MKEDSADKSFIVINDDTKHGKDEWWCNWYKCPNCEDSCIANHYNFCPICGKRIEWQTKDKTNGTDLCDSK